MDTYADNNLKQTIQNSYGKATGSVSSFHIRCLVLTAVCLVQGFLKGLFYIRVFDEYSYLVKLT